MVIVIVMYFARPGTEAKSQCSKLFASTTLEEDHIGVVDHDLSH